MRTLYPLILLVSITFSCISCHRNRLKTNEKKLTEEIITLEKQNTEKERATLEREQKDGITSRSKGVLSKEDRSVDPSHPPVVIDIAGNLNNVKDIRLSEVAASVSYIRIGPVSDTALPSDLKFKYYLLNNYIVAQNLYGIHLFSKEGQFIRSVVKNEYTGVEVKNGSVSFWNDFTLRGGGLSAWVKGDRLLYEYTNTNTGQKYIMEYDCSSPGLTKNYKFDPENPDEISGLGTIALDLNHGKTEIPQPRKHQGMFGGPAEVFFLDRSLYLFDNLSYAVPARRGDNMMAVLNNNGDTISKFTRFEKLRNYSKSLQRGTYDGVQYESNGKTYFRPEYNDTLFLVTPPNRLTPVFTLNLGEYKVTRQQGVDPDFKLTGKIIPIGWAETNDLIFLKFSKDDYDCFNTRKNKTVKIYHALFLKESHQLFVHKGDPFNYSPEILENDIDGGLPVWPLSYMIGNNGEILISLKGRELKDRIKSEQFRLSKAQDTKKKELEKLAASVGENEDILMIIK
jgi:hypothetical protein